MIDMNEQLTVSTVARIASNVCRVCHRQLTNPKSIAAGIGPVCARKQAAKMECETMSDLTDRHIDRPITDGIILERDENGVATNVPHFATHHSPTGFEFGYGGSGPADLAMNVVEWMLHHLGYEGGLSEKQHDGNRVFSLTKSIYQDFKWEFISPAEDNSVIPYQTVKAWVQLRIAAEDAMR